MSGFTCFRGSFTLVLGLALLSIPMTLGAQTAAERARAEELRQRIEERLKVVQEERLVHIEEALTRAKEAQLRYAEVRERAQDQLRKAQQVVVRVRSRVRLGVSLDGTQGDELDRQGARIQSIIEDTPAEEAGLQEGDIITHLNGHNLLDPIPNEEEEELDADESLPVQRLISLAQDLDAGDEVEVRYLREGEAQVVMFEAAEIDDPSFTVLRGDMGNLEGVFRFDPEMKGAWNFTIPDREYFEFESPDFEKFKDLRELEELEGMAREFTLRRGESPMVYRIMGRTAGFGLELTELNPGLAEYFSSDVGLLVLDVDEDSTLGLMPGDVILAIDGREVEDQGDVRRILGSYEDEETVSFTVVRKGQEIMVEGTLR
jgi:C-terminal processing protease CtpA/Prc